MLQDGSQSLRYLIQAFDGAKAFAPTTSNLRRYRLPILETRPNCSMPLDKFCRG